MKILTLPLMQIKIIAKNDMNLISRVFLPCTQFHILKLNIKVMIQSYQNHYFSLYKDFSCNFNDDIQTDPIIYTPFGKMLFNNDTSINSTKKIKNFFEHLKIKKLGEDISEYNNLVIVIKDAQYEEIKNETNVRDEEISYVNSNLGFKLGISPEEKIFFSIANDIQFSEVKKFLVFQA